jgi:hypothetical protein
MRNDPIVEEIHKIREKYAEKFGFDLDAIFANLKLREKQTDYYKVTRKPKSQRKIDKAPAAIHFHRIPKVMYDASLIHLTLASFFEKRKLLCPI